MDKEQLIYKVKHLPYYLKLITFDRKRINSGFKKSKKDPRDFETEKLGWNLFGEYKPLGKSSGIKTLSIKDQENRNTCAWEAATVCKEIDEKVVLSSRSLTSAGVANGLVSGNGFTTLEAPQKMLKSVGIMEESECPSVYNGNWNAYVNVRQDTNKMAYSEHKIQSYWSVSSKGDLYKLLDSGRPFTTAIDWYTGFNQGGGFKAPWIINKAIGYKIGGHSFAGIDYSLNYNGRSVIKFQNSYGKEWGDNGCFYVDINYLMANNYGFKTNLDIDLGTASFINKYDGRNVKGNSTTVYYIQSGKRKTYMNYPTYLAYKKSTGNIIQLGKEESVVLEAIPKGDNMDIKKSSYWYALKDMTDGDDDRQLLTYMILLLNQEELGLPLSLK